jgi:hypothetical protein
VAGILRCCNRHDAEGDERRIQPWGLTSERKLAKLLKQLGRGLAIDCRARAE